ncbi:hypothetical protein QJS66_01935 [Kocuria rhizophila]|nr:hypothetical protein QJS66_01935 [Kocuria rhizophila]
MASAFSAHYGVARPEELRRRRPAGTPIPGLHGPGRSRRVVKTRWLAGPRHHPRAGRTSRCWGHTATASEAGCPRP